MSHNFKPGDLAIVIRTRNPQNLGKCVEIVRRIEVGEIVEYPPNNLWRSIVRGWIVHGDLIGFNREGKRYVGFSCAAPEQLMPLRSDGYPVEQCSEELMGVG